MAQKNVSNKSDNPLNIDMISMPIQLCTVALLCLAVLGTARAEACRNKS